MAGKLLGALRKLLRSSPERDARDSRYADPTPIADAHLVMNSLNQMAAQFLARTGLEDPRLFATADYLRSVFQAGADERVSVHQEVALLQSYVPLLAMNRGLDCEFDTLVEPELDNACLVRRHLSCDILNLVVRALPSDGRPVPGLRLAFRAGHLSEAWAYTLTIKLRQRSTESIDARIESDASALRERLGPSAAFGLVRHDSPTETHWEFRVHCLGDNA